jgi:hypothetical protein
MVIPFGVGGAGSLLTCSAALDFDPPNMRFQSLVKDLCPLVSKYYLITTKSWLKTSVLSSIVQEFVN